MDILDDLITKMFVCYFKTFDKSFLPSIFSCIMTLEDKNNFLIPSINLINLK